jgi:hypothetical protein
MVFHAHSSSLQLPADVLFSIGFTVWLDQRSSDMVFSRPFAALTQVRKVRQVKPEKKI